MQIKSTGGQTLNSVSVNGIEKKYARPLIPPLDFPTGLGTIPIGIRSENPLEFHWKMFQNSEFITSHLKNF
jgi:hypothetical protein